MYLNQKKIIDLKKIRSFRLLLIYLSF
jgi:hypothetical protein